MKPTRWRSTTIELGLAGEEVVEVGLDRLDPREVEVAGQGHDELTGRGLGDGEGRALGA